MPEIMSSVDRVLNTAIDLKNKRPDDYVLKPGEQVLKQTEFTRVNKALGEIGDNVVGSWVDKKDAKHHAERIADVVDVNRRVSELVNSLHGESSSRSDIANRVWDKMGEKAKEIVGADADQYEGIVKSEESVKTHKKLAERKSELANKIIENLVKDNDGATNEVVGVSWEDYAKKAGIDISSATIDVAMLQNDPRFQEYRDALVKRVQELDKDLSADNLKKGGVAAIKNVWNRFRVQSKYLGMLQFNPDTKKALYAQMDESKSITLLEKKAAKLPKLDEARNYLGEYGKFRGIAQIVIDNDAVIESIKVAGDRTADEHKLLIEKHYDESHDAAIKENEAFDKAKLEESFRLKAELKKVTDAKQKELERELEIEIKTKKERAERLELNDMAVQYNSLAEKANADRQVGMDALVAIAEKSYAERELQKFEENLSKGELPDELKEILNPDLIGQVDKFIKSGKGDIRPVETFVHNLSTLVYKADSEEGLPTTIISLNKIQEANEHDGTSAVETVLSVGISNQDRSGNWEIRVGKRENGKVTFKNDSPVIRFNPTQLEMAFAHVRDNESHLDEAMMLSKSLEDSLALKGGNKLTTKTYATRKAAADAQVAMYKEAIATSKRVLATQLRTATENGSLNMALDAINQEQKNIAESVLNRRFVEMTNKLAGELDIPVSQVTVEALASLAAAAEHTQMIASETAEYLQKSGDGVLAIEVLGKHEEQIDALAQEYAELQLQESQASEMLPGEVREGAEKAARSRRRKLDKQALELGKTINNAFIEAVPEVLKDGSKTAAMTKPEFNGAVKSILKNTGYNPKDFREVIKKGPNKGMTLAEVVRENLSYDSELKSMLDATTDALRDLNESNETQTLLLALEGGDPEEVMIEVKRMLVESRDKKFVDLRNEVDRNRLAELLKDPVNAMRTGELYWQTAINEAMAGHVETIKVIEGLNALEGSDAEDVRKEAAKRLMEVVSELDRPTYEWTNDEDPLAGRPDVVEIARFAKDRQLVPAYWESIITRASAEKKMNQAA